MSAVVRYPQDASAYELILGQVKRVLDIDQRLPQWPFIAPAGHADICQFSLAVEGPFDAVLEALVGTYGDETVSLVILQPSPIYYRENYGSYPAFMTSAAGIADTYWDLVSYEPGGDPTGAASYTAEVAAIVGSSGAWGVWAERTWDIAIVLSQQANGPWLSRGVTFVSAEEALANFTEPEFKVPLAAQDRSTFLANVRNRGGKT
jgi:hypothetical protein